MNLKYTLLSALNAIKAQKTRSTLTILGILIGVASIIGIISIGEGATDLIISEFDHLGAETIMIIPSTGEGFDPLNAFYSENLLDRDLEALKRPGNVPYLKDIMPAVMVPGSVDYRRETHRRATIMGASNEFFNTTFDLELDTGFGFDDNDIRAHSRVAIIGHQVKKELFGLSEALGEKITVSGQRFKVVGTYPKIGQRGPFNIDDLVLIPHSSAQQYILGSNEFDRFIIKASSAEVIDQTVFDVTATLRESREIEPGEKDNFDILTQQGLQDQISNIMSILTYFLAFAVSIALLVGGIGIMNIMLVSVTERTKEIGLRKALGATKKAILKQFLWEAIILTVLGGVIGILIGVLISLSTALTISHFLKLDWPFIFPLEAAVLGLIVCAGIGLIFGLYPAKQAANQSPIEALQYE